MSRETRLVVVDDVAAIVATFPSLTEEQRTRLSSIVTDEVTAEATAVEAAPRAS